MRSLDNVTKIFKLISSLTWCKEQLLGLIHFWWKCRKSGHLQIHRSQVFLTIMVKALSKQNKNPIKMRICECDYRTTNHLRPYRWTKNLEVSIPRSAAILLRSKYSKHWILFQ